MKRFDLVGRDVTDLPGLWDQSDKIVDDSVAVTREHSVSSCEAVTLSSVCPIVGSNPTRPVVSVGEDDLQEPT